MNLTKVLMRLISFFFGDKFTKYIIPDEELDDGPNAILIHFSVINHQERCAKQVIITNGPNLYKPCE